MKHGISLTVERARGDGGTIVSTDGVSSGNVVCGTTTGRAAGAPCYSSGLE
jgi:hypothetical protein